MGGLGALIEVLGAVLEAHGTIIEAALGSPRGFWALLGALGALIEVLAAILEAQVYLEGLKTLGKHAFSVSRGSKP